MSAMNHDRGLPKPPDGLFYCDTCNGLFLYPSPECFVHFIKGDSKGITLKEEQQND